MSVNDVSWQTVIVCVGALILILNIYNTIANAKKNHR